MKNKIFIFNFYPKMKIKNLGINFKTLHTVGDGSCLVHAVLQGFSKDYDNLKNDIEKVKFVDEVRYHFSKILEHPSPLNETKNIYQTLSRGELEEISKDVKEAKIDYMKAYLNSRRFLTLQYIELISDIFDINIIFINDKDKDIYNSGDLELLFKKERETVFVYYIEEAHFETIMIENKTLFNSNEKIMKNVIKKLFKR
jgi:hypothetical protein